MIRYPILSQGSSIITGDAHVVADLAALKALTAPYPNAVLTECRSTPGDGGGGTWVWRSGNQSAYVSADVRSGIWAAPDTAPTGASGAWQRQYPLDVLQAAWFGVLADNIQRDDEILQDIIDLYAPYALFTTSGVKIVLPRGILKFDASINLTGARGVFIEGAGQNATECRATGNFPVFSSINTSAAPWTLGGISNMTIRGGGKGNANAHGIYAAYTNRIKFENIYFLSCRNCFFGEHLWQTELLFLQSEGAGADQSYNGIYMDNTDLVEPPVDNTVMATNCTFQSMANDGYVIVHGQGSKWVSCEAGGCGRYGWNVGNPASGTPRVQWMHIDNCLSDSNGSTNWLFQKGTATAAGEFIMTGTWTGNTGAEHMVLDGMVDVVINGVIAILSEKEAVKLKNCVRVSVSNVVARQYNNANGGYACVKLEDSTDCNVDNIREYTTTVRSVVTETGTSDRNLLVNISGQPTLVGANTSFANAFGDYVMQGRSTGNIAAALVGGATSTAYLGFGTVANPLLHNLARINGGAIEAYTNGGRRWSFGNGSGEAGFVNTTDMPIQLYSTTVASLPVWTTPGRVMWASNGRNSGEGAGAGTGCMVYLTSAGVWIAAWSGVAVTA